MYVMYVRIYVLTYVVHTALTHAWETAAFCYPFINWRPPHRTAPHLQENRISRRRKKKKKKKKTFAVGASNHHHHSCSRITLLVTKLVLLLLPPPNPHSSHLGRSHVNAGRARVSQACMSRPGQARRRPGQIRSNRHTSRNGATRNICTKPGSICLNRFRSESWGL
jgi:hypothetical protein